MGRGCKIEWARVSGARKAPHYAAATLPLRCYAAVMPLRRAPEGATGARLVFVVAVKGHIMLSLGDFE